MSGDRSQSVNEPLPHRRPVGCTEHSWCKAVPLGTGVVVQGLLLSKPVDSSLLLSAVRRLQVFHPILRSKLHFDAAAGSFSFLTFPDSDLVISTFDLKSTTRILESAGERGAPAISRFQLIIEHEMGRNAWRDVDPSSDRDWDLLHASVYCLEEARWAVVLRFHTAACDRTAAATVMRELQVLLFRGGGEEEEGVNAEIEKLIPARKANKLFWTRGLNLLGYSLNSFRVSNIDFVDAAFPRSSHIVRLQMNSGDTQRLLAGCKSRGIKLCGALVAAALIAGRASKGRRANKCEKYAVLTLINCRPILDPPLPSNSAGFYHSGILNSHDICGREKLWELAERTYKSFAKARDSNKHFSDMGDLNFLMCRAIENPGLTPSASMRTSFISVFEDSVIDNSSSSPPQQEISMGLEDCIGCSSVHGIGPSIAFFDTVRDGCLDCACAYPAPLHSREQITKLIDDMRGLLMDCDEPVVY
ncbi:hypothetical protein SAY87_008976 [Trapa incisa]|uniref:Uncharacterized protein n=1 Tax=Trapa incisa TaxID=236973 RepID=A0AAN7JYT8_9MYRT|nr:hypothetical protein SAY87_008976 [Trapa incisa]